MTTTTTTQKPKRSRKAKTIEEMDTPFLQLLVQQLDQCQENIEMDRAYYRRYPNHPDAATDLIEMEQSERENKVLRATAVAELKRRSLYGLPSMR